MTASCLAACSVNFGDCTSVVSCGWRVCTLHDEPYRTLLCMTFPFFPFRCLSLDTWIADRNAHYPKSRMVQTTSSQKSNIRWPPSTLSTWNPQIRTSQMNSLKFHVVDRFNVQSCSVSRLRENVYFMTIILQVLSDFRATDVLCNSPRYLTPDSLSLFEL